MIQGIPLRKLVSAIGLAVAITSLSRRPASISSTTTSTSQRQLTFKARLNAARVAQYIYTHGGMWQYQQLRLAELIQLPETGEQPIRQKIYDQANRLVLEEGAPLDAPVVTRSIPIVVAGSDRGCFCRRREPAEDAL